MGEKSSIKRILFSFLAIFLALLIAFSISEILLRVLPIPGLQLNAFTYDDVMGTALYPDSIMQYRNDRGDFVSRRVNRWGFLDKNHFREKSTGSYRIGFFGDSYTEAAQVALEHTFFRRIEAALQNKKVESFAFGVSGYGTLQSYLTARKWAPFFDIDMVVYVFVENDPGDNLPEIDKTMDKPYPVLTDKGIAIDNSFRQNNLHRKGAMYKIGDYLTAHSLLAATLSERIKMLIRYGIKLRATDADRTMANRASLAGSVSAIDLPSSWPADLRQCAATVTAATISRWHREMVSSGREFVILYVARQGEYQKPLHLQDSWKNWLVKVCNELGVPLVDPTSAFRSSISDGKEIFYDHLTKQGHQVFADVFVEWFEKNMNRSSSHLPSISSKRHVP